jgi:hypothetical protein
VVFPANEDPALPLNPPIAGWALLAHSMAACGLHLRHEQRPHGSYPRAPARELVTSLDLRVIRSIANAAWPNSPRFAQFLR